MIWMLLRLVRYYCLRCTTLRYFCVQSFPCVGKKHFCRFCIRWLCSSLRYMRCVLCYVSIAYQLSCTTTALLLTGIVYHRLIECQISLFSSFFNSFIPKFELAISFKFWYTSIQTLWDHFFLLQLSMMYGDQEGWEGTCRYALSTNSKSDRPIVRTWDICWQVNK